MRTLARSMAPWLAQTQWRERGIVSALADGAAPETPRLRDALAGVQRIHIDALAAAIVAERGARAEPESSAALALASLAFAALDGAFLQARLARDGNVLLQAAESVAKLLERDQDRV